MRRPCRPRRGFLPPAKQRQSHRQRRNADKPPPVSLSASQNASAMSSGKSTSPASYASISSRTVLQQSRRVDASGFGAAHAVLAEAEPQQVVEPAVLLHQREFVMEPVLSREEAGRLQRQADDGIIVRDVLAERDSVFAHLRSGRAEAVDIAVAEGVLDRRRRDARRRAACCGGAPSTRSPRGPVSASSRNMSCFSQMLFATGLMRP